MNLKFDLHCHPGSKPYLSHPDPGQKDDCWKEYWDPIVKITTSQASYGQLWRGGIRLAVVPVYVIEKPFTQTFLIEQISPHLTLLHKDVLQAIQIGNGLDHFLGEIEVLEISLNKDPDQKIAVQFIDSLKQFEPNKLNIVLAIEGTHGLMNESAALTENLLKMKQSRYRFFYLTLIHAVVNPMGTHAYAIKMLKGNEAFKPKGHGLTDLGRELIDLAYDEDQGRRMLIDIKHMSLQSRKDFYSHRKKMGYQNIPILATHMGCTGISFMPKALRAYMKTPYVRKGDTVMVEYERPQGIGGPKKKDRTHFNPWSINLYDEEIGYILDSNGLIGVNLDQRILGTKPVSGEYFTVEDFRDLFQQRSLEELDVEWDWDRDFIEEEEYEIKRGPRLHKRKHLRHVCNTILHIVKIGGAKAWRHLCLGSDFDGLIDPVNNCVGADELPILERELPEMLAKMIAEAKAEDPSLEFYEQDLAQQVRDILFNNGMRFMEKNY